jgi:hypothetical protein
LLGEHPRVTGRTIWYETVEQMWDDVDAWMETYNRERPHQSGGMDGRTPYQALLVGLDWGRQFEHAAPNDAAQTLTGPGACGRRRPSVQPEARAKAAYVK